MVRDQEAAGAIPVSQTNHPGVAQEQSTSPTTTLSVVRFHSSGPFVFVPRIGTRQCERRWRRFESSRTHVLGCRLGRTWPPNPSSSVQFAGSLLCPFLLGESGRRGVTAARSNLAIGRRIFYPELSRARFPPVARQLVHSPDKRKVKVRFLPGGLWSMSK